MLFVEGVISNVPPVIKHHIRGPRKFGGVVAMLAEELVCGHNSARVRKYAIRGLRRGSRWCQGRRRVLSTFGRGPPLPHAGVSAATACC